MTRSKRLLSMILVLAALFSLACIPVLAEGAQVRQYGKKGGYLAIGDSIARGLGASGPHITDNEYENFDSRIVQDSYPYTIAKEVGCTIEESMLVEGGNYWPFCFPGQTLAATLDLMGLKDNYYDSEYTHNPDNEFRRYTNQMLPYFRCPESFDGDGNVGSAGNIREIASKASLITIQLGMGEMLNRPARLALDCGAFSGSVLTYPLGAAKFVNTALEELNEGFEHWVTNYPMLIETLQEWNPDATIVLVGAINVVADVTLLDETLLPLGTAFSAITGTMNCYLQKWAEQYGLIYVDVSNAESRGTQCDWSALEVFSDFDIGAHPTPEGHAYIARQILAALPTVPETEPDPVTTDITVDLTHFTSVDFVLLDGVPVSTKDCRMDKTVLTVPCCHKLAKSLTVGVKNKDGGLDFMTYQLAWHDKTGYTAYRVYGKNGILPLTTKLADTVRSVVSSTVRTTVKVWKDVLHGGIFRLTK